MWMSITFPQNNEAYIKIKKSMVLLEDYSRYDSPARASSLNQTEHLWKGDGLAI